MSEREVRARAYELAVGWGRPEQADRVLAGLVREGELIELADGRWTTRELREREQQMLTVAAERASERAAPVSEQALKEARLQTGREIRGSLSAEQREALQTITGQGGVSVLVGQAGTGKGVVIGTAASAWRAEGYEVIGTAVAGATAERLGEDAKLERSLTTDSLLAKVQSEHVRLNERTVVVMDEAGMADTQRLAGLVEETARSQSKLVLVGDQAQLSAIGAGGMFSAIQEQVPAAELSEVHRAEQRWERDAWKQIREGQSEKALAQYVAHEQLHIADTREQAAEEMVQAWARDRAESPEKRTVMLTDASNAELDRINQKAQERRDQNHELGAERVQLPDVPYGIAGGDEVVFTKAMFVPGGERRVENGTRGTVLEANSNENRLLIQIESAKSRQVSVDTGEHKDLRSRLRPARLQGAGPHGRSRARDDRWLADRPRARVCRGLPLTRENRDLHRPRGSRRAGHGHRSDRTPRRSDRREPRPATQHRDPGRRARTAPATTRSDTTGRPGARARAGPRARTEPRA